MEEVLYKEPEVKAETKAEKPAAPAVDKLEAARQIADRIEKANAEHKMLLDRQENLLVQQKLGGRSEHTKEVMQKTEHEIQNEEAHNILMKALK